MAVDIPPTPGPEIPLPELLAPAGSPAAFRAAVAAGADAVYLGGKRFGARQYAMNFTEAELDEAVAFAHARGVKVYVTVNTLVHDRELPAALGYLVRLYASGVDAVLVQDTGLATLARKIVPGLPLHASTQMTIHSADGVTAAAAMGLTRVVLARELTLDEIGAIAAATAGTGAGLEVFAHGALCFSYSGQCLLSSVIGGRSGNRGMCAQPCRKPYRLVAGNTDQYGRPEKLREIPQDGEYLLSPRDLCTFPRLARLVHSPVVSLKIEGRMKSPEYVAIVTAAYRQALDAIGEGREPDGRPAMDELALAFCRGFTEGYLFGRRHSPVMGRERPDNRGLFAGTIVQYRQDTREAVVRLAGTATPAAGDGLFIRPPGGRENGCGFGLNVSPERAGDRIVLPVPEPVRQGSELFITSSAALAAKARRIIAGGCPGLRKGIPVDCEVTIDRDGQVTFTAAIDCGAGRSVPVSYRPAFALVPARTRPLPAEELRKRLGKTGSTPFRFRRLSLSYDGTLFAPVAEINRMRREFLARAGEALAAAGRPAEGEVQAARKRLAALRPALCPAHGARQDTFAKKPHLAVLTDSLDGAGAAIAGGCSQVWFEPAIQTPPGSCRYGRKETGTDPEKQIVAAIASCRAEGVLLAWSLPRITRQAERETIQGMLPRLHAQGMDTCIAGTIGAIATIRSCCPKIRIFGSAGLNVFNHCSAAALPAACSLIVVSPELSGTEIAGLVRLARRAGCGTGFGLTVQGTLEAMVSENCILELVARCKNGKTLPPAVPPFFGLRDGTGRVFPLRTDGSCRTHIGNADETCLVDHLPAILEAGIDTLVIDARGRPPAYAGEMTGLYRDALQAIVSGGPAVPERLATLRERARKMATGGITAGYFIRGLREE